MVERHPELENHGVFALNCETLNSDTGTPRTLIVLGAPRGGTSAIAGALAATGLYMGRGASEPVFESLALANAIDAATSRELGETFCAFRDDPALRVAILTGGGSIWKPRSPTSARQTANPTGSKDGSSSAGSSGSSRSIRINSGNSSRALPIPSRVHSATCIW